MLKLETPNKNFILKNESLCPCEAVTGFYYTAKG